MTYFCAFNKKSYFELHYRVSNRLTTSEENIYIEPFLQEAPTENMFKSKTRTYPVDLMYPYQRNYFSLLQIPEGYEVGHLPTNRTKALKDMEFEYTIAQQDDKLMVSLIYVLKKSIYAPGEYALLKSFFEELIGKSREKIVLKRKQVL